MPATALQSRFAYQARDAQGKVISGIVAALTLADATRTLRAEGKYILDIKPARGGVAATPATAAIPTDAPSSVGGLFSGIKKDEVINFTIQLSVMVDTGVPLSDALIALSEQSVTPAFAAVLKTLVNDVQSGRDFSSALEKFPRIFPKYYTSLVRAAEMSGTLGQILRRLADYLVSQRDTAKKVRGALIYPSFMLFMSIAVTIFLLTAVLPRFAAIFAARKAALPLPTQILIGVSDSLLHNWYLWLGGAIVAGVSAFVFFRAPSGRRTLDWLKLHIPIFSGMFHKLYLSRSLQTIGTMISSGVQVLDCLAIVREVAGNSYYAELWDDVREKIQGGQQLSEPLLKSKLVPRSIAQMIHSGEKTGELPSVLTRLAGYMEEDLKTAIKTATQFIEPVMIGLMGLVIGSVAIAMLMPILTISKVMSGK